MEKPKVKLVEEDGNAWAIMGRCSQAWKKAGNSKEDWNKIQADMMSGDYDHLLQVAMEHFDTD